MHCKDKRVGRQAGREMTPRPPSIRNLSTETAQVGMDYSHAGAPNRDKFAKEGEVEEILQVSASARSKLN